MTKRFLGSRKRILEIFSVLCPSKITRSYVSCGRIISDFPIQHAGGFWNTPPTCSYNVRRVRKWFCRIECLSTISNISGITSGRRNTRPRYCRKYPSQSFARIRESRQSWENPVPTFENVDNKIRASVSYARSLLVKTAADSPFFFSFSKSIVSASTRFPRMRIRRSGK